MYSSQSTGKKWSLRVPLVLAGLVGLAVLAGAAIDQVQLRVCMANLRSRDPAVREKAIKHVSRTHEARAMPALLEVLETEQDRRLLEMAGHATMRTYDPSGVALLQRRADEGPDDVTRAKLICDAARLSDRDLRLVDWLMTGTESTELWRRAGSAAGMLELGQPVGGLLLIELAGERNANVRAFAVEHLRRTAGPVTEAIGQPIAWPENASEPLDRAFLDHARSIWQQHVTVRVLNDVLNRLRYKDPDWYEIGRLLHARERFARLLN